MYDGFGTVTVRILGFINCFLLIYDEDSKLRSFNFRLQAALAKVRVLRKKYKFFDEFYCYNNFHDLI